MITRKTWFICCLSLVIALPGLSAGADDAGPAPYMGEEPPGMVPKIFAPGFVSLTNRYENNICFTKDGREYYFVTRTSNWSSYQIFETHYENGQWTTPRRASFSNSQSLCPSLANNDQDLYLSMSSPNIYKVTRTATGWSSPIYVGSPVSSSQPEWSCHISTLGNMWICSWRSGGVGGCDLWKVLYENGRFTYATNFRNLNTSSGDCGPAPGPNEDYIVFMSGRPGGFGNSDLYVSFPDGQGDWTDPKNLGPTINTSGTESSAYISPDHKYLFYSGTAAGTADVYWVSVEAFLPDPNGPVLNLATSQRFASIQAAVNYADSGQTIILSPGIYKENIIIPAKELTIRCDDPQESASVTIATVSGEGQSPVITILQGGIVNLKGLTICDGTAGIDCSGAQLQMNGCFVTGNTDCGIEVSRESDLEMTNCIVAGNSGAGLCSLPVNQGRNGYVYGNVNITNCTIVQNQSYAIEGDEISVTNSILYFNDQLVNRIQINGDNVSVMFSDVQGEYPGEGNIDADPLFVDVDNGDYHLRADSPCIDAGDPVYPVGDEPEPNSGCINIGAYGGTAEAALSNIDGQGGSQ